MATFSAAAAGLSRLPEPPAAAAGGAVAAAAVVAAVIATVLPAGAEPDDAAPPAREAPSPEAPAPPGAAHDSPAAPPAEAPPPQTPAPGPHPDQAAKAEPGYRFAFHPSGNGYLRLDRATGAVAVCTPEGGTFTCTPGRDDRVAIDAEIARLQRDNAALKGALLEHGIALPGGAAPVPVPVPPVPAPAPPPAQAGDDDAGKSPAEADDAIPRPPQTVPPTPGMVPAPAERPIMDTVARTWRRLVRIVTNLRRELP